MRNVEYPLLDMRFPSGLRVLAEQDGRSPVVALVLVVGAGSSSDPPGKEGLAHYVEHLAFRSRPFGKLSLARMLDSAGAGQWNASTSLDQTVYHEIGPKEALGQLLQLEGTRMAAPIAHVAPGTIAVELDVVRNELRQRNETGFIGDVLGTMQGLLFPVSHPYVRPVVGTHASLSKIGVDDVTAFLEKHYRPDNMTLLIIGDIDLKQVGSLVEQSLPKQLLEGTGNKPRAVRLAPLAPEPPAPPPSALLQREAGVATPELWIGWSLPRAFDTDAYLVEFVNSAVGNALWGAEDEDEDIGFVNTFVVGGKEASMLLCQVGLTRGSHPEASYEHVLNALSDVWTTQVSAKAAKLEELALRRKQRRAVVDLMFEAENIAMRGISRATSAHFTGDPTLYSRAVENIKGLEPGRITEFAEKYVNRDRARAAFFRPTRGGGAAQAAMALGAHTVEEEDKRPVRADVERLQSILPRLGASSFGTFTLENGLDVVIVERHGLPLATANVLIRGGMAAANDIAAAHAGMWLQRPNSVWHGEPSDMGASLRRKFDDDSIVYSIMGANGNTTPMLAMLAERVQSLGVDAGIWDRFERDRLPYLQAAESQPEDIADRAFRKELFGMNSYGRSVLAADFKKLNARKVEAWLDATHVPNNAVLVVVGEVSRTQVEAEVRTHFGGWKRGAHSTQVVAAAEPGDKPVAAPTFVPTHRPDATQAQIRWGCLLPPVRNRATDVRHDVAAELLTERVSSQLRGQSGVTYGVHATSFVLRGGTAYLEMTGAVDNSKLSMALASIKKSLEDLMLQPVDTQQLARAKLKLVRRNATQFLANQSIAGSVLAMRNLGFPLASLDEGALYFADVTPDQVRADMKACMSGRPTLSIVGDEPSIRAAFKDGWMTVVVPPSAAANTPSAPTQPQQASPNP